MGAPTAIRLQANTPIDIRGLPGLCAALWDRHDTVMPAEALLHLYEERWTYIDPARMDAPEVALLEQLVQDLGHGVFLD